MNDRPSHNLCGLDIEMARRTDEVCRLFEADWREGRQPRIEDFLVDVSHEGRPAPRAALEALNQWGITTKAIGSLSPREWVPTP